MTTRDTVNFYNQTIAFRDLLESKQRPAPMDKEQLEVELKAQTRLTRKVRDELKLSRSEIAMLTARLGALSKTHYQLLNTNLDISTALKNQQFQNEEIRSQLQHLQAHGITVKQEHYVLNEHVHHEDPLGGAIAIFCIGSVLMGVGAIGCFNTDVGGRTVPIAMVIIGIMSTLISVGYIANRLGSESVKEKP